LLSQFRKALAGVIAGLIPNIRHQCDWVGEPRFPHHLTAATKPCKDSGKLGGISLLLQFLRSQQPLCYRQIFNCFFSQFHQLFDSSVSNYEYKNVTVAKSAKLAQTASNAKINQRWL
jgi:hypothetical protein